MKHPEGNHDDVTNRVLAGLREAEAPAGMEQRVLRTARERVGTRRRWILRLTPIPIHSWMVAATSIVAIALIASWKIGTVAPSHHATQGSPQASANLPPANAPGVETLFAPASNTAHNTPKDAARVSDLGRSYETRHAPPEKPDTPQRALHNEEALAVNQMSAPSHPAPPMPLTEQERLLLRMIHKGDPVELAMLDPGFRTLEEANSKAEFDKFFSPPATVEVTVETRPPTTADQPATGENK